MPSHAARRATRLRSVAITILAAVAVVGAAALTVGRSAPSVSSASASSDPETAPTAGTTTTTAPVATATTTATPPTCSSYRTAVDPGMFPMSVAHARACPDGSAVEAIGIVLADDDGNLWLCDDRHHVDQPACVDDGLLLVGVTAARGGTYTGVKHGDTITLGGSG